MTGHASPAAPAPAHRERLGYLQIAAGVSLFGSGAVLVTFVDLPPLEVVAWHSLLCASMLTVMRQSSPARRDRVTGGDRWVLLVLCGLYALDHLLFVAGVQVTAVANVILMAYTYPVLTVLLAAVVLRERLDARLRRGLTLAVVGCAAILSPQLLAWDGADVRGHLFGLGIAVLVACQRVFAKFLSDRVTSITIKCRIYQVAAIALLPVVLTGQGIDGRSLAFVLAYAMTSGASAGVLVMAGVRKVPANRGAVLSYLEPGIAVVTAWIVLRQTPSPIVLIGGLLVVIAAWDVAFGRVHRRQRQL